MKTLVIHPKDPSTDFLNHIYKNLPDVTLITGGVTKDEIRSAIREHDQVMMMGHGAPSGLFSIGQFPFYSSVIDSSMVEALSEKDNNIFIWCNANIFVENNGLKGFYSGMFISEVGEALYCNVKSNITDIKYSNHRFAQIVGGYLKDGIRDPRELHSRVRLSYGLLAEVSSVAKYNHERLYYQDGTNMKPIRKSPFWSIVTDEEPITWKFEN